jgi:hypothetical protein
MEKLEMRKVYKSAPIADGNPELPVVGVINRMGLQQTTRVVFHAFKFLQR